MLECAEHLIAQSNKVDLMVWGTANPDMRTHAVSLGIEIKNEGANPGEYAAGYISTVLAAKAAAELAARMPVLWRIHEAETGLNMILHDPRIATVFRQVHHVVFPHARCRDSIYRPFLTNVADHAISIIPSGIKLCEATDRGTAEDKDDNSILFVGSMSDLKRPQDLIRATLDHGEAAVTCRFAGNPAHLNEETRALIDAAPKRFNLLGTMAPAEIQNEFRRASVVCLPSSNETFARTPLEAAWHECALVLSDLDAHRNVWKQGENALLHPVGDTVSLGMMLNLLFSEPAYRIKLAKAAAKVPPRFTCKAAVVQVQSILEQLVAIGC